MSNTINIECAVFNCLIVMEVLIGEIVFMLFYDENVFY